MSFTLKADKSVGSRLAQLARKQLGDILHEATHPGDDGREVSVHAARKSFKKLRALLRLVRPELGKRRYRRENLAFRDAGRPLTEVRDARVLLETLDKLREKKGLPEDLFQTLHDRLVEHPREVHERVLDQENAFDVVADATRDAETRVDDWTDVPDRWQSVGGGLKRVYRQARAAFRDARREPSTEKLHEWRKQVKYLRHQLEVLAPIWPEVVKELAEQAHHLGDRLGDDHDLAVLRGTLENEDFGSDLSLQPVWERIDARRGELQEEAYELGQRVFQEKPRDFIKRLKGFWSAWRAEQDGQTEPAQPYAQPA